MQQLRARYALHTFIARVLMTTASSIQLSVMQATLSSTIKYGLWFLTDSTRWTGVLYSCTLVVVIWSEKQNKTKQKQNKTKQKQKQKQNKTKTKQNKQNKTNKQTNKQTKDKTFYSAFQYRGVQKRKLTYGRRKYDDS